MGRGGVFEVGIQLMFDPPFLAFQYWRFSLKQEGKPGIWYQYVICRLPDAVRILYRHVLPKSAAHDDDRLTLARGKSDSI